MSNVNDNFRRWLGRQPRRTAVLLLIVGFLAILGLRDVTARFSPCFHKGDCFDFEPYSDPW